MPTESDRQLARHLAELTLCNPFSTRRVELETLVLGERRQRGGGVWSWGQKVSPEDPDVRALRMIAGELLERTLAETKHTPLSPADHEMFARVAWFHLYHSFFHQFDTLIRESAGKGRLSVVPFWGEFEALWGRLLPLLHPEERTLAAPASLFAVCFQIRRAFNHIFDVIIGGTGVAARLRASVWESIFTHDLVRYRRVLAERMAEFTCLITGPSGSGKELVARAIGLSRYIPFDPARRSFASHFEGSFLPVNLSALSATLIESELFGHRRGAFTGALQDRAGYLEVCPPHGTVFLDEIGELDPVIQVKLLRVLQERRFQRIGDVTSVSFRGKFIAATNRDIAAEVHAGRFRQDLYYRLCSDVIHTPSLREQVAESPEVLETLVDFIASRLLGKDEGAIVSRQVCDWIAREMPPDYPWHGNVRELEQCVRNVIIRGRYERRLPPPPGPCRRRQGAPRPRRCRGSARRGRAPLALQQPRLRRRKVLPGGRAPPGRGPPDAEGTPPAEVPRRVRERDEVKTRL